ncbi:hypothetical protein SAMN05421858_3024 [Haladaptatus litoreus]|uniref:DUF1850 domain-containing protein n=1 Tax=Haladaptatus litoreus TaxID=553468 RepID=A0A1N7CI99_9EURY|nr:DUF1850 domain-containing protein [Haladaptatus litoreus]SIR63348.1 hypothetical protein SAMN05421858_3024 [Haladaptatus litoreus]
MRIRLLLALLACGVVVGVGSTTDVTVLHIQDARTGETTGVERIDPGQEFAIHYIHSFDKTPIHEVYVIRDGKIVQIREEFQYFAIGLEYTERDQERVGNFTVLHMERAFDSFSLRVATYTNQSLVIGDERTPLTDYAERWDTLTFSAERMSYLEYAYYKTTTQA